MHRKRNLEERLAACSDLLLARGKPCKNLKEAAETFRDLIDYQTVFGNDNPVQLEVGCGNGYFVLEMARRHPELNFIAVEVNSNVILTALEGVKNAGVKNVRFLNIPAEILACYLPEKSLDTLYLNFSTPLPESTRAKQRLTSPRFLAIYKQILVSGGKIVQKTDSEPFFDYSIEQYEANGFTCGEISRDLHHSEYAKENIVTEYEKNFSEKGFPIFRVVATLG